LGEEGVTSETLGHLIAGVETTSTTLSYILYTLATSATVTEGNYIQQKLVNEIACCPSYSQNDLLSPSVLPYLDACVKEGLRLFGAGPSVLERVVPSGKNIEIQGYCIPEGTLIGAQAWSLHRKEDVYPNNGKFMPERWLGKEHDYCRERMLKNLTPFGHGTRICAGQTMANIVLKTVLEAIVRVFEIRVNRSETNEENMAIRDSFVIFPKGMVCKLIFTPRELITNKVN